MHWVSLVVFFLIVAAAAALGALFTPGEWYAALAKPSWTPPNWLFGPVWTALYVMIAIAGWLVFKRAGYSAALGVFALQLVLNAAWSWLFFGRHAIGVALADIVALLVVILVTIAMFWPLSRAAGILLVPYAVWVGFAALLNAAIWRLNT